MTISLRTALFLVAALAALFSVFAPEHRILAARSDLFEQIAMLSLLMTVCGTFASVADDGCRDPGSIFVAALFGVLGFFAILFLGLLVPAVWVATW